MGWPSDLRIRGTGFDSRLAQVIFGSLFDDFGDVLGCVWEWFGDVFGWVWDGFEKMSDGVKTLVWEGLEKNVRGGQTNRIFKNVWEYSSPSRGASE